MDGLIAGSWLLERVWRKGIAGGVDRWEDGGWDEELVGLIAGRREEGKKSW